MSSRIRFWAGLAAAVVAAAAWTVGITVMQGHVEPVTVVAADTYWLRDLRWLALMAVATAFVWTTRGDRRSSSWAAGGFVAALAVDIGFDRLDNPTAALGWGAVLTAVLVPGAWFAARRRTLVPDRRVATTTAFLAAAGAVAALAVGTPAAPEAVLYPAGVGLGLLLTGLALANAVEAAEAVPTGSRLVLGGTVALAALLLVGGRLLWTGQTTLGPALALMAVELTAVILLVTANRWQSFPRAAMPLATMIAVFFAGLFAMTGLSVSGFVSMLTDLAGNPTVNAADADVSYPLFALPVGIAAALVVLGVDREFHSDRVSATIAAGRA